MTSVVKPHKTDWGNWAVNFYFFPLLKLKTYEERYPKRTNEELGKVTGGLPDGINAFVNRAL